jgi:hypothetical protein
MGRRFVSRRDGSYYEAMLAFIRGVAFIWMLPATLVGVVLAVTSRAQLRWRNGVLWCEATRGVGGIIRQRSSVNATTFGTVVLLWRPERLDAGLEAHELVHVTQYRWLGLLFFPAYLTLRWRFGGGERNPMEKPAYEAGRAARRPL